MDPGPILQWLYRLKLRIQMALGWSFASPSENGLRFNSYKRQGRGDVLSGNYAEVLIVVGTLALLGHKVSPLFFRFGWVGGWVGGKGTQRYFI